MESHSGGSDRAGRGTDRGLFVERHLGNVGVRLPLWVQSPRLSLGRGDNAGCFLLRTGEQEMMRDTASALCSWEREPCCLLFIVNSRAAANALV